MSSASRTIRPLQPGEVTLLIDWAAGEGWNPGLRDAALFHAADPDGFIGAFVGEEMAAGIAAVAYGADFGFIGLYISRPDLRGRGHGKAVWQAGMERLGSRIIGLDGVAEQQANYRSMGFEVAYRTVRYTGRFAGGTADAGLSRLTAEMHAATAALDRRFFPGPRPAFLEGWLKPPHKALAVIRDGAILGYGVARQCREGWKIGPIVAMEEADARKLLEGLAAGIDTVHVDVPETAGGFVDFLLASGFTPGFETARMYRSGTPETAPPFAVASMELG